MKTLCALIVLLLVAAPARAADPSPSPQAAPDDLFFDDSVVHDIRLAINSRDWQSLKEHYQDNTYYPCDFRWRSLVVRNVGIRSRGSGSRNGTKPGLRVDFNRYSTDQRFLGLKSVVLRNNTQDPSNLHERLGMLLFRRLGMVAPREAHARLFVNDEFAGVYTIVESVDKPFLARNFEQDDGYLYEFKWLADRPSFYFDYRGDAPELYVPLPFQPQTHETDPRPEYIVDLIRTVNETPDAMFRSTIAGYVDLEAFIREAALDNFLADSDGLLGDWGMNNFYLYRFEESTRFAFVPWDKSEAFKGGVDYDILHNLRDASDPLRNRLMTRALAFPDLYDVYLNTLLECARSAAELEEGATEGPGWLEREVTREYEQIRYSVLADSRKPFSNEEFDAAVADLVNFARERGAVVQRQVDEVRRSRGMR